MFHWQFWPANVNSMFDSWHLSGTKRNDHNRYVVVHRDDDYDAEKNFKLIGTFADLASAQRCCEASASRARPRPPRLWPR
jgi:hypothetical protein